MTEMEAKLKEAGVPVTPFPERIWNELHLRPGINAKRLHEIFGGKPQRIYATLSVLLAKGLVNKHEEFSAQHRMLPCTYTAVGATYRKEGYPKTDAAARKLQTQTPAPKASSSPPKGSDLPAGMGRELLGCTVLELRAIRDFINGVLK